jgi:RES domain-containing protein
MRIWRISNFADLSGRGGMLIDGRWNRRGTPIVYCTDHPSTALLEILVHATRETMATRQASRLPAYTRYPFDSRLIK